MKNKNIILYFLLIHGAIRCETKKTIKEEFQITQDDLGQLKDFSAIPITEVSSYWDNRPCNLKHSSQTVGTKEYFDEVEQKKYFVEPHIPHFAEFPIWNGKRVLEIGCGLGTETTNFAREGAHVSAIELSTKSLDLTAARLKVYGLNAHLFNGNAENLESILPTENQGSYDLVWSFGVIHHTPHPKKIIEGIKKFIKKGGELRIMVYSKISYKLFFIMRETNIWDFNQIDNLVSRYSEAQVGCPITHTYTEKEILELLGTGWTNISMTKTHIFPYKIDKYIRNEYEKEDAWKNVPQKEFEELEKELGWHYLIQATYVGE
jgi:2-polyprenyl-3-methyl-5-hydroxy-6-metoxy-1,4-benzoquinol methylase